MFKINIDKIPIFIGLGAMLFISEASLLLNTTVILIPFVLASFLLRNSDAQIRIFFGGLMICTAISIFPRIVFLSYDINHFKFDKIISIGLSDINQTLSVATLYLLALFIPPIMLLNRLRHKNQKIRYYVPLEKLSLNYIFFSIIAVVYGLAVIALGFNNKDGSSKSEVIKLILPIGLLLPFFISSIFRQKGPLKKVSITLVLMIVVVEVLRGSKAGIFLVPVYISLLLFFTREIISVNLIKLSILSAFLIALISFVLYHILNARGLTFHQNVNILDLLYLLGEMISRRLNVLDGLILAVNYKNDGDVLNVSMTSILKTVLAKLLPGVPPSGAPIGVQVGQIFNMIDANKSYGGALGLFGICYYLLGLIGGLIPVSVIGLIIAYSLKIANYLQNGVFRDVIILVLFYNSFWWLISGNFDILLSSLIIVIFHLIFYTFVFQHKIKVIKYV